MSDLKQKALDKMLEEMNLPHSDTEDYIHNWLCAQEDDELFECVLKEGKTIKDALNHLISKAKESSKGSSAAVMSDEQGFKIVVSYFKGKETSVKKIGVVSTQQPVKTLPKKEVKNTPKKVAKVDSSPLLSMFDFGVDDSIAITKTPDIEDYDDDEVEEDED